MGILVSTLYRFRSSVLSFRNLKVPVKGEHVSRTVWKHLWKGGYERPEIEAGLALIRPGDKVLELGTGMGIVSGVLAKSDASIKIKTYEANPSLASAINDLHKANGITNVETHNKVLLPPGMDQSTVTFNLHENFTEGSIEDVASVGSTEVEVEDFQAVFDAFLPDVMVCDIEGGEARLFEDISLNGLRALVIELHPEIVSRSDIKRVYDVCLAAGLYPRVELSDLQVEVFERVD